MDENEARLMEYAIHTLRNSKDDNDKIATIFLLLRLNAEKLYSSQRFLDVYLALSPVFIYRLLKSANTESPVFEEIELGIQILSYFLGHPQIIKREEISSMIECCVKACSFSQLSEPRSNRECFADILSTGMENPNLRDTIFKAGLIKYFSIIKFCDDDETERLVNNCRLIQFQSDSKDIFKFLIDVCSISNKLSPSKKSKTYELVILCLSLVDSQDFHNKLYQIKPIVEYSRHFLVSSNPVHSRSIEIIARLFTLFPFNSIYEHVEEKTVIGLWLNLCLIDLDIFLNKIQLDKLFNSKIPSNIESCLYVIEIILNQNEYEIPVDFSQRITDYTNFIIQVLCDYETELFNSVGSSSLFLSLFRSTCFGIAYCIDEIEYNVISKVCALFSKIRTKNLVDQNDLVLWILPLLSSFPSSKAVANLSVDDGFMNILSSMFHNYTTKINENQVFINSEVFGGFLLDLYALISHPAVQIYDYTQFLDDTIEFHQFCLSSQLQINSRNEGLLFLLGTSFCRKNCNSGAVNKWLKMMKTRKLSYIFDLNFFGVEILEELITLLSENNELRKNSFSPSEIEKNVYSSKFFVKNDESEQLKITNMLDQLKLG